ncbi:MAG: PspC domain-containing protein [Humibacillus sp.]|nr:PspC domain-containing protein [Humibacillus sp.]
MTKKTNSQGHGLDGLYDGLRRPGIMRSSDDKWFAGVCTGVARWLGVDPLVVRGAFILFAIFFGMGVALYLVLWLLMPNDDGEISLERAISYGDGGSIFLLVITIMSVLGGGPWFGDGGFRGVRVGGIAVVAVLAWWFLTRTDAGRGLVASSPWGCRNGSDAAESGVDGAAGGSGSTGTTASSTTSTAAPSPGLSTGNAAAAAGAAVTNPVKKRPAPTPSRPQVRTIGFAAMLVVLGAAIGVGALLGSLAQNGSWAGNHLAIGVAAGLAVVGLALVIAGIAGRRSGVLNPIAGFAIAFLAFTSVVPAGLSQPWEAGDKAVQVTTLSATNAYQLGVGQLTVDLTKAQYAATPGPDVVTAALGVGQLDIVVPAGTSVVVNATGRVGEVATFTSEAAKANNDNAATDRVDGTNWSHTFPFGSGPVELTVDAEVGLGQIRIITGATP